MSMATTGYADVKEFQKAEVMVAPSLQTEGKSLQRAQKRRNGLAGVLEGVTQKILVVDFGAQYAQLIARRVREARVFSEIVPRDISVAQILEKSPTGIIFQVARRRSTQKTPMRSTLRFSSSESRFSASVTGIK